MEWNRNTDRDSSEKETLLLAEAMPKIDLHCHLDGSIEPFLIREKMEKLGMKMTAEEVMQRVGVDDSCRSLAEYLEKFDLPIRCIQDADFLNEAAYYLGRHTHSENVVYLEVRYAPQICLTRGMTLHDSISSVIDGLERAHRQYGIGYGVICCAMRHLPMEQNRQMLEEGSFASNVELAEAGGRVRSELAQSLLYLKHDLSEEANRVGYFSSMDDLPAGYPDATAALAEKMEDKQ